MKLVIVTPAGTGEPIECDSVNLIARDDANGEGGGSVGIRRGHIAALAALEDDSPVTASLGGKRVYSGRVSGGFAKVENDVVTVMTESAWEE